MLDASLHKPSQQPVKTLNLDALSRATSTLDRLGPRRTKHCAQCDTTKTHAEFNRNPAQSSGLTTQCSSCERVNATNKNPRINAISRLAARIAGGVTALYRMDKDDRIEIRMTATRMYDLGVDFSVAAREEFTNREGFVYAITNKAFPHHVKIGRAFDPEARLGGYQTGCPFRDYRIEHAVYFEDCHTAEKDMHDRLSSLRAEGEWFRLTPEQAEQAINQLREETK